MPFTRLTCKDAGSKGGTAVSDKKRRSAQRNGKQGGRPATRTLIERLLRQKLRPGQIKALSENLWNNRFLLVNENQQLTEFFGVSAVSPFDTKTWNRKSGRMPRKIRYIVQKLVLGARFLMTELKDQPPKDYVRVPVHRSRQECEEFARLHPGHGASRR